LVAGSVSVAMLEGFGPTNAAIGQLLMSAANGRGAGSNR
jgi:hypothetical protein